MDIGEVETMKFVETEDITLENILAFGWLKTQEYTERRTSGRSIHSWTVYVLVRNINMPKHQEIAELESMYRDAAGTIKRNYPEIEATTAILLFLILIVPGILYIYLKQNKKKEMIEANNLARKKMDEILDNARRLIGLNELKKE